MEKRYKLQAVDKVSGPFRDGGNRRWEDLSSDLLVSIFSRIGIEDLVASLPYVCSSWRCAVRDPFCWRVLDFRSWDTISHRLGCRRDEAVDFADLLNFTISRSAGIIDCVYFPSFSDEIDLEYVANRCPILRYFSMENPDVSKIEFCEAISKLKFLKGMAVDANLICHQVLQNLNQCSNNFIELKVFSATILKEMASIICECLPNLQKLVITQCAISIGAICTIIDGLKKLEFLDISGYEIFVITNEIMENPLYLKVFRWLFEHRYRCESGSCHRSPSECVRNQRVKECMLDQQFMEWLATLPSNFDLC